MDLDLRKVRYFLAVAEHRNFGRAAQALHIAQPVLSRQIRALEQELNAQLFVRDRRGTELTAAGEQFRLDAGPLLAGAEAAQRRVVRAAPGRAGFTVGFMPGLIVTGPVRALAEAHPGLDVRVLRTTWADQVAVLHDGRADVSLVRLPVDQHGLRLRPLLSEPRVAMLPATHRLAGRAEVALADLADEHLLQDPDAVPEWRDLIRSGRPRRRPSVPVSYNVEEKLENVAAGRGFVVLPASVADYYTRPDLVSAPITDLGPNQVALAWLSTRRSGLISEFEALAAAAWSYPEGMTGDGTGLGRREPDPRTLKP